MKNSNKTTGKFSIAHFEVAKLKNSRLIIGGEAPVLIVTTRPATTTVDITTNPSQTNTTRTSIAGNTISPPKPI